MFYGVLSMEMYPTFIIKMMPICSMWAFFVICILVAWGWCFIWVLGCAIYSDLSCLPGKHAASAPLPSASKATHEGWHKATWIKTKKCECIKSCYWCTLSMWYVACYINHVWLIQCHKAADQSADLVRYTLRIWLTKCQCNEDDMPQVTYICKPGVCRLLHSPSLVVIGLYVGYETWPGIGWHHPFVIG